MRGTISVVCAVIAIVAGTAHAETPEEVTAICSGNGRLAETIMTARQAGVSYARVIEIAQANDDKLAPHLAEIAYSTPRYHTEEMQRRAAQDLRNDVEIACFRALSNSEVEANE